MSKAATTASIATIIRRVTLTLLAVVMALVVTTTAVVSWTVQRPFPTYQGEVTARGLSETVTVQRNSQAVPTITAKTSHDLFYAQGYAHAQDRFWEMDFRRHLTAGRLSELFGRSQVQTDKFLRTLGWHRIAQQEVDALGATDRAYYEAYAEGVNAYLAQRKGGDLALEYTVLSLTTPDYTPEPWTPVDSVAWLKAMAWDLRTNVEDEAARALMLQHYTPEQVRELYPDYDFATKPTIVAKGTQTQGSGGTGVAVPTVGASGIQWQQAGSVVEAISALVGGKGEGLGSNSWVVSGRHTASGLPLLANDSHLVAELPNVWTQVHLRCADATPECPFDVAGFSLSGLPGVIIGHNARIAWGITNLATDVSDLYIERLQGDSYWRDGALVPLQLRTETIRVANGESVDFTVRTSVHGPILSGLDDQFSSIAQNPRIDGAPEGDAFAVALRWTALEPTTTPSAICAMNRAANVGDFRSAAAAFTVPAQNLVYADVEGNIAYQAPGTLPIRGAGDGWLPQPGWNSAYDWKGYIPFAELPAAENPNQGFIVTANAAIVDGSYPYFLSRDWDYGYRAQRITELLSAKVAAGSVTADDMRTIQLDEQLWIGKRLLAALASVHPKSEGAKSALKLLADWNSQSSAESAAAAYLNVTWDTLVSTMFVDRDHPVAVSDQDRMFSVMTHLLDAPNSSWWVNDRLGISGQDQMLAYVADRAYERLAALQGESVKAWSWGSLHALTLRSGAFGSTDVPVLGLLFNRGPYRVGGGASVVNATGWPLASGSFQTKTVPSMRMVVDVSDWDKSTAINLTGTSGHAFHPNYVDQTPLWAAGKQLNWAFSPRAVAAETSDTLTLVPSRK